MRCTILFSMFAEVVFCPLLYYSTVLLVLSEIFFEFVKYGRLGSTKSYRYAVLRITFSYVFFQNFFCDIWSKICSPHISVLSGNYASWILSSRIYDHCNDHRLQLRFPSDRRIHYHYQYPRVVRIQAMLMLDVVLATPPFRLMIAIVLIHSSPFFFIF